MHPVVDNKTIGQNIREARCAKHLTQIQLAKIAGISDRWLGRIERGQGCLTIQTFLYLCQALNCSPMDLLKP